MSRVANQLLNQPVANLSPIIVPLGRYPIKNVTIRSSPGTTFSNWDCSLEKAESE